MDMDQKFNKMYMKCKKYHDDYIDIINQGRLRGKYTDLGGLFKLLTDRTRRLKDSL